MKYSSLSAILKSAIVLCLVIHTGWAIKCHNCSTQDDPRCADPFDVDKNSDMLVECESVHPNAKFCRKIDQTVDSDRRVFRRCAWEEHKKFNCYFGTTQYYKSTVCICDQDGCNGAPHTQHNWAFITVILITLTAIGLF